LSTRNAYILLPPGMGGHRTRHPMRICVMRTYKTHSNPSVFPTIQKRFYSVTVCKLVAHLPACNWVDPPRDGRYVQSQAFQEICRMPPAGSLPWDRIALTARNRIAKFKVYSVRTERRQRVL
jgi:hypothetical protein